MPQKKTLIIVVVGPTAIGKTSLAIQLAQHYNTAILSADSRQIFKELTIGTAVPSPEELAAAPHFFIQNKSIFEKYSVGDYEVEAIQWIENFFKKNNILIVVGGSGLYINALLYGLDQFPKVSPNIRKKLNEEFTINGLQKLQQELKEKDPIYFEEVDINNSQRVIRALEICRGTGKTFSQFRTQTKVKRSFNHLIVGLEAPRNIIYERIEKRVEKMIEERWVEEAKTVHPFKHLNALNTVGYKELFNFFEGKFTLEQAKEEIKKNTRRFAKRQLTWFKKNEEIVWFNYKSNLEAITKFISSKI